MTMAILLFFGIVAFFLCKCGIGNAGKEVYNGTVIRVDTEIDTSMTRYRRMHDIDPRSYRLTIRYEVDGVEYVAKSAQAFQRAKYFPGDTVSVSLWCGNKEQVWVRGS